MGLASAACIISNNAASRSNYLLIKFKNKTLSFGRHVGHRRNALKGVPHLEHDYLSSFKQSYHGFVALPSPFVKLPNFYSCGLNELNDD